MKIPKKGKYPNLEKKGFLIPAKVSTGEKGRVQHHGTEAFVPINTEIPKGLKGFKKTEFLRKLHPKF